ncbi:MAG: DUF255 domain-containing protein [Chitinophagia bacterium]|nr:DUF255 domain-containing protein [Chitinophagia bacterium]
MGNRLQNEQSLYLRQHAHNPVNWYPWGDEAFAEAARANKPVLVSIGYAACHWCHVMERESFEHEAVAAYMVLYGCRNGNRGARRLALECIYHAG